MAATWKLTGAPADSDVVRTFARSVLRDLCSSRPRGTEGFHVELTDPYQELGLLSYTVPAEWGGVGGNVHSEAVLAAELAYVNVSAALLFTDQAVCTAVLDAIASDAIKEWIFSEMHQGKIFGIALTEPGAGSDAAGLRTRASATADGFVLDGSKIFITNGDVIDYVIVFARVSGGDDDGAIAAFLVDRTTSGFAVGRHEKKMGLWGTSTVELIFSECHVPADRVLGDLREGFAGAMVALERGRVAIGGVALGVTERVFDILSSAFGRGVMRDVYGPVDQAAQFALADIYTEMKASRLLIEDAGAIAARQTEGVRAITSAAKVYATDLAMRSVSKALSLLSPDMVPDEEWADLEEKFRDTKILQIFEGANELLRWLIAREVERSVTAAT